MFSCSECILEIKGIIISLHVEHRLMTLKDAALIRFGLSTTVRIMSELPYSSYLIAVSL